MRPENPFSQFEAQQEAQRRGEARQNAINRFGEPVGSAYDDLVSPPDGASEEEMEIAEDVFANAVVSALQSGDAGQRIRAVSAVVHLARTFSPPHRHREVRIR